MDKDFGHKSFLTWPKGLKERIRDAEDEEESVFSDNPDSYLRRQEDQRNGWANYE